MAFTHISESEALYDFAGILARVQAGEDILIERGSVPVAVVRAPVPQARSIEDCIAILSEDSAGRLDKDFTSDLNEAIALHREPLALPQWD